MRRSPLTSQSIISRSTLRAIEKERVRIARELHDELGQSLTLLRINIDLLERQVAKLPLDRETTSLAGKLGDMRTLATQSLDSLRHILTGMRPPLLDELGLDAAIQWQTEDFSNRAGIACEINAEPVQPLPVEVSTNLFRIFQELLTNVARHSGASNVRIQLARERHSVVLAVSDNGRGLPAGIIPAPNSCGLRGIRERASALGGSVEITANFPRGVAIIVSLPLGRRSRPLLGHN
ncbi:MAG TPA: sensor histidine kinase [Chthoniobacterales bacterium]